MISEEKTQDVCERKIRTDHNKILIEKEIAFWRMAEVNPLLDVYSIPEWNSRPLCLEYYQEGGYSDKTGCPQGSCGDCPIAVATNMDFCFLTPIHLALRAARKVRGDADYNRLDPDTVDKAILAARWACEFLEEIIPTMAEYD